MRTPTKSIRCLRKIVVLIKNWRSEKLIQLCLRNFNLNPSSLSINLMILWVLKPFSRDIQPKIVSLYQSYQMLSLYKVFQKNISVQQVTIVTWNLEQWLESTHYSNLYWEDLEITSESDSMQATTRKAIIAGQTSSTYIMYRGSCAKILLCQLSFAAKITQLKCLACFSHNLRKEIEKLDSSIKVEAYS